LNQKAQNRTHTSPLLDSTQRHVSAYTYFFTTKFNSQPAFHPLPHLKLGASSHDSE